MHQKIEIINKEIKIIEKYHEIGILDLNSTITEMKSLQWGSKADLN